MHPRMETKDVLPPLTPELYVSDIERSLAFYVGALGFTIRFQRPEEGFAAIDFEGACFMLDQTTRFDAASSVADFAQLRKWNTGPLEHPFGRGVNFLIHASDCLGLYEKVRASGHPIKLPMEEKFYRVKEEMVGVRQFMVMDPDGFLLRFDQIFEKRPVGPT